MQRRSRSRCCKNELKYDREVKYQKDNRNTECQCQCCQCCQYCSDKSRGRCNRNSANKNSYSFSEHSERSNNERYNSDSSYCSRRKSPSSCIVTNESPPLINLEDLDDIKRCFQEVDRDCDGWINASELCYFMQLRDTPITYSNAENIVYHSDTCYHYSINRNQLIYLAGKYGVSTRCSVKLTEQEYNFALMSLRTPTTVENYIRFANTYLSDRNKARFDGTVNYFEEKAEMEYEAKLCEQESRNYRKTKYQNCCTTDTSYDSDFEQQKQPLTKERSANFKATSSAVTMENRASKQPDRAYNSETYLDFNSLKRNWEERIQKELINIRKSEETFRRLRGRDQSADKYCGKPNPASQRGNCTELPNRNPSSSKSSLIKSPKSRTTEEKFNSSSASLSKSGSSIKSNESSTSRKSKSGKDKNFSKNEKSKIKITKSDEESKLSKSQKSVKGRQFTTPVQSKSEVLEGANSSKVKSRPLKSKSENSIKSGTKSKKSFFGKSTKSENKSSQNNAVAEISKAKGDSSQISLKSGKTGKKEEEKSKRSKSTAPMRKDPEEISLPITSKSRTQVPTPEKSEKGRSGSGRKQKSKIKLKTNEKLENIPKNIGNSKSVLSVSKKPSLNNLSSSRSFTSTGDKQLQPQSQLPHKKASARNNKSVKEIYANANATNQTSNLPNVKSNKNSKRKTATSGLVSFPASVKPLPTFLNSKQSISPAPRIPTPPPLPPVSKSKSKSKKKVPKSVSGPNITTSPSKHSVSSGVSVQNIAKEAKIGRATSFHPRASSNKGKKKVTFTNDTKKTVSQSGLSSRMTM